MSPPPAIIVLRYSIDGIENSNLKGANLRPVMEIHFNQSVDTNSLKEAINLFGNSQTIDIIRTTKNKTAL